MVGELLKTVEELAARIVALQAESRTERARREALEQRVTMQEGRTAVLERQLRHYQAVAAVEEARRAQEEAAQVQEVQMQAEKGKQQQQRGFTSDWLKPQGTNNGNNGL